MRTLYIPVPPGTATVRVAGEVERGPGAVPAYATAEECRAAHPGCDVWRITL
jgi:hypothetical protein